MAENTITEKIEPRERQEPEIETKFKRLRDEWKRETLYLSNIKQKILHPAYQKIIGMGKPVVPLILMDLKQDHADWSWALSVITDENPIQESDAGKTDKMAEAWLNWGRKQGLLHE
jgi:hypothetical protein